MLYRIMVVVMFLLCSMCLSNVGSDFSAAVTVEGRHIFVDGVLFTIKGVGYAPVPIGVDPETASPYGDYFTPNHSRIYNRDLPLLRQMGANTIRLWGWNNSANHKDFLDKAYNNGTNPIYVIVTFWMGKSVYPDISSPTARAKIKSNFRNMVACHKNHPAVLMWAIGNELNAPWMYGDNLDDLFSLIDEMCQEAHLEEGENFHPVTTPLADIDLISTIATYDSNMSCLDVWSVQVFRGKSFGTLFADYVAASAKPLVITEYGIDAYDDKNKTEYELIGDPYQAIYAEALWKDIEANSDVCCGGSIMAYCDEWWKGKHGESREGCPDYDPSFHSDCGYPTGAHPDGYSNEEWWGIMRTKDNGSEPDIMEPRVVYHTLRSLWDSVPPNVGIPSRKPSGDAEPDQPVTVSVEITDAESGVKNVSLLYKIDDGAWENRTMNYNFSSGFYEATIPGQKAGTWVKFKIVAHDHAGNNATRDGTEPYCIYHVIPTFPSFFMQLLFMITTLAAAVCKIGLQIKKHSFTDAPRASYLKEFRKPHFH
jgi:hypothetical protein